MKKTLFTRRTLSWLLAVALLLSLVPFAVAAEESGDSSAAINALPWNGAEAQTVLLNGTNSARTFALAVETAGTYHLASLVAEDTAMDPAVVVYDAESGETIAENDNFSALNFGLNLDLEAGKTYHVEVSVAPTVFYAPFDITLTEGAKEAPVVETPPEADDVQFVEERMSYAVGDIRWPAYVFLPEGSTPSFVGLRSEHQNILTNDGLALMKGSSKVHIYTGGDGIDNPNLINDTVSVTVNEATALELGTANVVLDEFTKALGFMFTAPEAGEYVFAAIPSGYDTFTTVYTRDPKNHRAALEEVDFADDENGRDFYYVAEMEKDEALFFSFGSYDAVAEYQVFVGTKADATALSLSAIGNAIVRKDGTAYVVTIPADGRTRLNLSPSFGGVNGAIPQDVTYTLGDPSLATVTEDGLLTLYRAGNLTVTATSDTGLTATISIMIVDEETGVALGDVNIDGKVDSTDARLTLQFFVGSVQADDLSICNADVDGDNKVDSTDARLILQKFVGTITEFPKA